MAIRRSPCTLTGGGKVYCFAADPLYARYENRQKFSTVAQDSPVVQFFGAIQNAAGVKAGHDIWRFKLPPYKTDIYRKEPGICLTNNYVYDVNEPLLEPNNVDLNGTYSYARAPDGMADDGVTDVPFASGYLTNRLEAFETREKIKSSSLEHIASETPNWVVSWKDPAPVAITFDLKSKKPLTHCRLVFSGAMPALIVSGSTDGESWLRLATTHAEVAGTDVKNVRLYLDDAHRTGKGVEGMFRPGSYRYVRFGFSARKAEEAFELCEVDIWGRFSTCPIGRVGLCICLDILYWEVASALGGGKAELVIWSSMPPGGRLLSRWPMEFGV